MQQLSRALGTSDLTKTKKNIVYCWIEDRYEYSAKENIWTYERGIKMKMEIIK
jgi:hypothetical protein